MAGNQMPVLTLDVNEEHLRRLEAIFEKYRNGEVVDADMAVLCEAIAQRNEEVTKIQAEIDRINGVVAADATEEEEVFEETSEE